MSDVDTVNFTVFPLLRRFFDPHFGFFAAVFRQELSRSSLSSLFAHDHRIILLSQRLKAEKDRC
jgi:hypothetical protein